MIDGIHQTKTFFTIKEKIKWKENLQNRKNIWKLYIWSVGGHISQIFLLFGQNAWCTQLAGGNSLCGSWFQRFLPMVVWFHCCGSEIRQHVMAEGHEVSGCSLYGIKETEHGYGKNTSQRYTLRSHAHSHLHSTGLYFSRAHLAINPKIDQSIDEYSTPWSINLFMIFLIRSYWQLTLTSISPSLVNLIPNHIP